MVAVPQLQFAAFEAYPAVLTVLIVKCKICYPAKCVQTSMMLIFIFKCIFLYFFVNKHLQCFCPRMSFSRYVLP